MKFKVSNQHPIAICIVDNHHLCQSGWSREISVNLSDQMIYKFVGFGYDVYIDSNEDALLKEVANGNYTHAVVIASGTSFKLNDKIFDAIKEKCQMDFALAGHILDRKESYYELHHQFYIIRLNDYRELGCPELGKEQEIVHTKTEPIRSSENVHDDYVPLWIKKGIEDRQYSKLMHGWNLLTEFLNQDKIILDIGENIRNVKKYLYYEYDHVFIRELPELYYHLFFGANFVPSWNSDSIKPINFDGVDQYITTGTGINWIRNLEQFKFKENTTVVFVDVNPNCLQFMKELINWDGEDYGALYKEFITPLVPNGSISVPENYYTLAQEKWIDFKSQFTDWNILWAKIKKLNYKFIPINFTASYNLDWIEPNKTTFMNVSDLFNYNPFVFNTSLKYRIASENRLIETVKETDPNIYLLFSARAADGFGGPSGYYGKVSEFELTDINVLNKPQWHSTDWYSLKILR